MFTKQEALSRIEKLIERFTEQIQSYKKSEYNETLTRRDFIDPFFKSLGWDIDNENAFTKEIQKKSLKFWMTIIP